MEKNKEHTTLSDTSNIFKETTFLKQGYIACVHSSY